jgi:hypothetical protein
MEALRVSRAGDQLFAEKQVFRSQPHVRREAQPNERDEVAKQLADREPR